MIALTNFFSPLVLIYQHPRAIYHNTYFFNNCIMWLYQETAVWHRWAPNIYVKERMLSVLSHKRGFTYV